jgi:hypothetical protein
MKEIFSRIIGWAIISALFLSTIIVMIIMLGLTVALVTLGIIFGLTGLMFLALYLITKK